MPDLTHQDEGTEIKPIDVAVIGTMVISIVLVCALIAWILSSNKDKETELNARRNSKRSDMFFDLFSVFLGFGLWLLPVVLSVFWLSGFLMFLYDFFESIGFEP